MAVGPLPAHLTRVEERIELPLEQRQCSTCKHEKQVIGEDVTEVLEIVPQKLFVRRIVRPRYACPSHAEEGVCQAPAPSRFIPKGAVGEGLLAEVLLSKYVNHQPLSRQEKNFKRQGVDVAVSTLVGWIEAATEKLAPIVKALRQNIVSGRIAFSDDTLLPVLTEDREGGAHRGYMWVYSDGKKNVVFDYTQGRGRAGPLGFLSGFQGYLHTDAYAVYESVHAGGKVEPVYCWAHARRKFIAALDSGDERARRIVQLIRRLYAVERIARNAKATPEQILEGRQRVSRMILEGMERTFKRMEVQVLPKSLLGEAMAYVRSRWAGFRTFLKNGNLSLDNNFSERQVRQVVMGRRNYFFCGSEEGARRAAILYSLCCTCNILGVDAWKYFAKVFSILAERPEMNPQELVPAALKPLLA